MSGPLQLGCAAVLFDLDGVLVDSAECVERTWHRWALEHRLNPVQLIGIAHGRRTLETVKLVAPELVAAKEFAAPESGESTTTDGTYAMAGAREPAHGLPPDTWAIGTY